jgi:hypothetical protein
MLPGSAGTDGQGPDQAVAWARRFGAVSVGVYARLARMCQSGREPTRAVIARSDRPDEAGQPCAPLAQSAERLHGKEKVYGSIP